MPFKFKRLEIPEVALIEPEIFPDARGFFLEAYKQEDFKNAGIEKPLVQINHSQSQKGVLRGLHYQLNPKAQSKLVYVIFGEIFDVAVDIRKGSRTFGKWVGLKLDSKGKKMLYIPEGFAHGFCVLSDTAEIIYLCSNEYSAQNERGIIWNDSNLNIAWPLKQPILSQKDSGYPTLEKAEINYVIN